jgi:hypothetical protein
MGQKRIEFTSVICIQGPLSQPQKAKKILHTHQTGNQTRNQDSLTRRHCRRRQSSLSKAKQRLTQSFCFLHLSYPSGSGALPFASGVSRFWKSKSKKKENVAEKGTRHAYLLAGDSLEMAGLMFCATTSSLMAGLRPEIMRASVSRVSLGWSVECVSKSKIESWDSGLYLP